MSADLLRQAATILRRRAEQATSGPWQYATTEVLGDGTPFGDVRDPKGQRIGDSDDEGSAFIIFDGSYVATMHPGVGLALADTLDAMAARAAELTETLPPQSAQLLPVLVRNLTGYVSMAALARLIVGGGA